MKNKIYFIIYIFLSLMTQVSAEQISIGISHFWNQTPRNAGEKYSTILENKFINHLYQYKEINITNRLNIKELFNEINLKEEGFIKSTNDFVYAPLYSNYIINGNYLINSKNNINILIQLQNTVDSKVFSKEIVCDSGLLDLDTKILNFISCAIPRKFNREIKKKYFGSPIIVCDFKNLGSEKYEDFGYGVCSIFESQLTRNEISVVNRKELKKIFSEWILKTENKNSGLTHGKTILTGAYEFNENKLLFNVSLYSIETGELLYSISENCDKADYYNLINKIIVNIAKFHIKSDNDKIKNNIEYITGKENIESALFYFKGMKMWDRIQHFQNKNEIEKVLTYFSNAVYLDSNFIAAQYMKGIVLKSSGDTNAAKNIFNKILIMIMPVLRIKNWLI